MPILGMKMKARRRGKLGGGGRQRKTEVFIGSASGGVVSGIRAIFIASAAARSSGTI
jgi:hypothetical protein